MSNVHIQDVLPYVPHRPPMVWVDEIVSFTQTSGECLVHMREDSIFLSREGLRKSSCLEFIAQSYGYCSVAYDHKIDPSAKPLKKAFLASFKNVVFADATRFVQIKIGDSVAMQFADVRKIGSIVVFTGQALHKGDEICRAQIRVYCES